MVTAIHPDAQIHPSTADFPEKVGRAHDAVHIITIALCRAHHMQHYMLLYMYISSKRCVTLYGLSAQLGLSVS